MVRLPLIGQFNVLNALAALAAASGAGMNLREAVGNLGDCPQVPGRLEAVSGNAAFRVFVDYAHTPDAVENALRTVRGLRPRRVITVFGCGGDRDRAKRAPDGGGGGGGERRVRDHVRQPAGGRTRWRSSRMSRRASGGRAMWWSRTGRAAIRMALEEARPRDIVLIAGKGHETYQEVKGKRHPFDDREVARRALFSVKEERIAEQEERERVREEEREARMEAEREFRAEWDKAEWDKAERERGGRGDELGGARGGRAGVEGARGGLPAKGGSMSVAGVWFRRMASAGDAPQVKDACATGWGLAGRDGRATGLGSRLGMFRKQGCLRHGVGIWLGMFTEAGSRRYGWPWLG